MIRRECDGRQRGIEQLESRWVLSAIPVLSVAGDQTTSEGALLELSDIGGFTDVVEGTTGGGSSIGLDPNNFSSAGVFSPTADVIIDTDLLTVDGSVIGTTTTSDVGFGPYEIAVFTFDSFVLDAGITLSATGSRPLAILSQSTLSVSGTIDVSAAFVGGGYNGDQLAGPGGGNGGLGNGLAIVSNGDAAAGAPVDSGGVPVGGGGGTGGGHGGIGGRAENSGGNNSGTAGVAFGDLSLGIQGGSGGATAGGTFNGFVAGGGGGGGGIELGAVGPITIGATGRVLADGGNGGNGSQISGVGSGGGGAGGGILLHATSITLEGLLSATGGDAGEDAPRIGGGGGGGEILVVYGNTLSDADATYDVAGGAVPFGGSLGGEAGADGIVTTLQATPAAVPIIESYDYSIDWGDGSPVVNGTATIDTPGAAIGDVVTGSFDGSHVYADDGEFTVVGLRDRQ